MCKYNGTETVYISTTIERSEYCAILNICAALIFTNLVCQLNHKFKSKLLKAAKKVNMHTF